MLTDRQEVERIQEVCALILWLLPNESFTEARRVRRRAWRDLSAKVGIAPERLRRFWFGAYCPDGHLETLRAHAAELSRKVTEQDCITN